MSGDAAALKGKRVLLVEDDYFLMDEMRRNLQASGAEIAGAASNIEDALAMLGTTQIDAAVLDIGLQGEMTFAVADALQERGIPFVFTTGYDRTVIPSRHAGRPYHAKPVAAEMIVQALSSS